MSRSRVILVVAMLAMIGCTPESSFVTDDHNRIGVVSPPKHETATSPSATKTTRPVASGKLVILPRSAWGNGAAHPRRMDRMGSVSRITIHHEGAPQANEVHDRGKVAEHIKRTYLAHRNLRGWSDIAYHFAVDRSGRVWELRSISWQGAHAGDRGLNKGNVGIEVLGNFNKQQLTPAQKQSLTLLVERLCREHDIAVGRIHTHRELKRTSCPGKNLQGFVDEMRDTMKRHAKR